MPAKKCSSETMIECINTYIKSNPSLQELRVSAIVRYCQNTYPELKLTTYNFYHDKQCMDYIRTLNQRMEESFRKGSSDTPFSFTPDISALLNRCDSPEHTRNLLKEMINTISTEKDMLQKKDKQLKDLEKRLLILETVKEDNLILTKQLAESKEKLHSAKEESASLRKELKEQQYLLETYLYKPLSAAFFLEKGLLNPESTDPITLPEALRPLYPSSEMDLKDLELHTEESSPLDSPADDETDLPDARTTTKPHHKIVAFDKFNNLR